MSERWSEDILPPILLLHLTKFFCNTGTPLETYSNDDIQNFARGWTGFTRQEVRSNFENMSTEWLNRMDPMKVEGKYRDPFPKVDLGLGFVGDKKPLCVELPTKQFLKKGAKYRLLGSSPRPDLHDQPSDWFNSPQQQPNALLLDGNSNLRSILSSLQTVVTLESEISCVGTECNVDNLRLVKIQQNPPIYYEYTRPACVELAFYGTSKKISTRYSPGANKSMCANAQLDGVAMDACCGNPNAPTPWATHHCKFDVERTSYNTANTRCQSYGGGMCDWVS